MRVQGIINLIFLVAVTFPKSLIPSLSPSRSWRRSMQSPYQLPHPLPPLPVRKGVRGRRPKSQTIAMLKAIQNGQTQSQSSANKSAEPEHLEPRLHKKRGPKPGSKVGVTGGFKWSRQCASTFHNLSAKEIKLKDVTAGNAGLQDLHGSYQGITDVY